MAEKKTKEVKEVKETTNSKKGTVISFRRSLKHLIPRHFILDLNCKNREAATKMIGKEVSWKSSAGKIIKGKVSGAHGNKGLVRAIFERGLPGQAMNNEVDVR
jgi:large subunit ribosomal protein L35Ae